ncbi:MAG TPA: hypothetical protein DCM32_00690, partial [Xanthomonadaceae bacterium]|nr:hypothetical protein [Xanthomonadaceae bacterium]
MTNPPAAAGVAPPGAAEASPLIDVETLRARLAEPALRIVDARFDLADSAAGQRAFGEGSAHQRDAAGHAIAAPAIGHGQRREVA